PAAWPSWRRIANVMTDLRSARRGPPGGGARADEARDGSELAFEHDDQERDDDGEERHAFDERREDDRGAADVARGLGLARDAFGGGAADAADADAGTDDGQTSAETGAELRNTHGVRRFEDHRFVPCRERGQLVGMEWSGPRAAS